MPTEEIRQLFVHQVNSYAIPLINDIIGRQTNHLTGEYEGDQDDYADVWGYFQDGTIIGVIGLGSVLPGVNRRYLGYFVVDEKHQGEGIGGKLLAHLEGEIKKRHIQEIIVETYDSVPFGKARRFYANHGFTVVGHLDNFLGNGVSAIFYSKTYR